MKPIGRPAADQQPESIEFVPKRELDRAQQENEKLRKESERLQKEIERLKQETERLRRNWKPRCALPDVRPPRIHAAHPNSIRSAQAANPVAATAGVRAAPSRGAWSNGSPFHCRSAARIAVAG